VKKLIKLLFVILCIVGGVSIYFILTRPKMNNSTKIICKYFEDITKKQEDKNMDVDVDIDFNSPIIEQNFLPEVIDYQNTHFQFSGYEITKEAVYSENYIEEDFCDYFNGSNLKENVYKLKSASLKYGFAYKYEDIYYLYFCLDNEFGGDAENFDELLNRINANGKLRFYGIELGISTFKGHHCYDKDIVCYGDVDKLADKCIKGKRMTNMRIFGGDGRMTLTNKTNLKTASILIWGYMEDTGIPLNLHITKDGYLNLRTDSLRINTCFQISDEQLETLCQYILQNFEIYVRSETKS